jgi:hypothetical protein
MCIGAGNVPAFTARRIVLRDSPVAAITAGMRMKTFISLMFISVPFGGGGRGAGSRQLFYFYIDDVGLLQLLAVLLAGLGQLAQRVELALLGWRQARGSVQLRAQQDVRVIVELRADKSQRGTVAVETLKKLTALSEDNAKLKRELARA